MPFASRLGLALAGLVLVSPLVSAALPPASEFDPLVCSLGPEACFVNGVSGDAYVEFVQPWVHAAGCTVSHHFCFSGGSPLGTSVWAEFCNLYGQLFAPCP